LCEINLNKIDIKYNRKALHYSDFGTSLTQKDIFGRNSLFYLFINVKNEIKKEDPISTLSYLL
jgi:hypothetical protein